MAANDRFFSDPDSRKRALGLQKQIYVSPTETIALQNGGMLDPQRYDIDQSRAIYRFTTITTELRWMVGGEWWVDRKALEQIIRFSEVNNVTMGRAVRLLCCVPLEWENKVNFLIAARTKVTLAAWRGLANSAAASSDLKSGTERVIGKTTSATPARNDIAAWRCWQLFIPGLKAMGADATAFLALEGQYQLETTGSWFYE